jgi:hypothetical protein
MTDEMVRFELGFRNGGSTGGLVPENEWKKLEDALKAGSGGLVELAGADQRWLLRVEEISWVRRHQSARKLGFGPH